MFTNFTDREFTARWNGRKYTFGPGQSKGGLQAGIAVHFARCLANEELLKNGSKQAIASMSPKKPFDHPLFMECFNKAYRVEHEGMEVDPETGMPTSGESGTAPVSSDLTPKRPAAADPYDAASNASASAPKAPPQELGDAKPSADSDDGGPDGFEDDAKPSAEGE